jgi:hypothetical protein
LLTHRRAGQEKPDSMRQEGKDKRIFAFSTTTSRLENSDTFAQGKWVKEILLDYSVPLLYDELRLAPSGNIGDALGGQRYDDRYTIVFTEEPAAKRQRIWYREETLSQGFRERVQFISARKPDDGTVEGKQIVRKVIALVPADEDKFLSAMAKQ